ncbi:MAG: BamA/TamA family outer membrane protein [Bacteroidetes bacterium]|nr:BamA/TamA family outer membrane protein [Bacteroidota bacterium]
MKKFTLLTLSFLIISVLVNGQEKSDSSLLPAKKEKQIKGWSFGAIPAIAFDSDIGFKYGAVLNLFDYGNGTIYPDYRHSIYLEWSRTTKGSGINQITYDSKYLIKGIRFTGDISYFQEQALDFYGFNGYQATYNHNFEDDNANNPTYLSRMYYRIDRQLFRLTLDFLSLRKDKAIQWVLGYGLYDNKIGKVDIKSLNEGRDADKLLPAVDTTTSLFEKYKTWGIIPKGQENGGTTQIIKLGIVYDTRDNESNPMRGIWSEALLLLSPSFIGNNYNYVQFAISHRQYFTLKKEVLNLACRVAYQGKIAGEMPFYMLPFLYASNKPTRDGLGGAKTIRGVLRNRLVGEGMFYSNFELRWKFLRTQLFKQNFYIALSGFTDMGEVIQKYNFIKSNLPQNYNIDSNNEGLHIGYGSSLHFVLNSNFILNFTYARAKDVEDGNSAFYINLNYLF